MGHTEGENQFRIDTDQKVVKVTSRLLILFVLSVAFLASILSVILQIVIDVSVRGTIKIPLSCHSYSMFFHCSKICFDRYNKSYRSALSILDSF